MIWLVALLAHVLLVIGGILVFNIYFRKQIHKDATPRAKIDEAYEYAERIRNDDDDFGNLFHVKGDKVT